MLIQNNSDAKRPAQSLGNRKPASMQDPVLGVDKSSLLAYARALPLSFDEATKKWGLKLYDLMQGDGAVEAAIRKWKQEVFSDEFRLVPPPGYEDDAQVKEDIEFLKRALDGIDCRLEDLGWEILDAGIYGHSLIEPTWKPGKGEFAGKYVFEDIRVVPHDMYVLVQDAFGRFLGVIGWVPGRVPLLWEGPLYIDLSQIPGFIPAWRFGLHVHNKKAGSIAGRSRLQGAYNPFKFKRDSWVRWVINQKRFASAIPIGEVAPETQAKDPDNKTPEQELADMLGTIDESSSLGLPSGTKVTFAQAGAATDYFPRTMDACDRQIMMAILGSAKTIMEAKNDSQAAQGTAQEAVDEDTSYTAAALCATITRQLLQPLIQANRGAGAVCPWLILGSDAGDFVDAAPGIAALYTAGAVCDNQEADIWKAAGVVAPDVPLSQRKQQQAEQAQAAMSEAAPGAKPDEDDGDPDRNPKGENASVRFVSTWSRRRQQRGRSRRVMQ